ncbi:MAG: creatininase family protein [Rhodobacteraceae bacterium]|nr:creatininase family protein [Paracoccaceae bacterium]
MNPDFPAHRFAAQSTDALARPKGRPIVLLPVGAVEQHGPHLPLGVDIWLANRIANAVAAEVGGIFVAEPLPYGTSAHHRNFAGTMSLKQATFIRVLADLGHNLYDDGYFPVFFNGHGGNRPALSVAVATLGEEGVRSAAITYFEYIREDATRILPNAMDTSGHACALETSLMMHLFAATVKTDRIPEGGTPPCWPDPHLYSGPAPNLWRPFDEMNPTGVIGTPSDATPEHGAALYRAAIAANAEVLRNMQQMLKDGE